MNIEQDIARMAEQERRLRLDRFDQDTAWNLGVHLRELALARAVAVTIEVRLARETVFRVDARNDARQRGLGASQAQHRGDAVAELLPRGAQSRAGRKLS